MFKFKNILVGLLSALVLSACGGGSDGPSVSESEVKRAIVGKKIYVGEKCKDGSKKLSSFEFMPNNKVKIEPLHQVVPYKIEGNKITIDDEIYKVNLVKNNMYIQLQEGDNEDSWFYAFYDPSTAIHNANESTKCIGKTVELPQNASSECNSNTKISLNSQILKQKTLYRKKRENGTTQYVKITFNDDVAFVTLIQNGEKYEQQYPYSIENGKLKIIADGETIYYTLKKENSNSWKVLEEIDEDQDGSIDTKECIDFYLTKPNSFPRDL